MGPSLGGAGVAWDRGWHESLGGGGGLKGGRWRQGGGLADCSHARPLSLLAEHATQSSTAIVTNLGQYPTLGKHPEPVASWGVPRAATHGSRCRLGGVQRVSLPGELQGTGRRHNEGHTSQLRSLAPDSV